MKKASPDCPALTQDPRDCLEGKFPGMSNWAAGGGEGEASAGALLQQLNWPEELFAVTTQNPEKTSMTLHFI